MSSIPIENYEEIVLELKEKRNDFIPIRKSLWFHRIFTFESSTEISQELIHDFLTLL